MRKDHHTPPVNWMGAFKQVFGMCIPSANVHAEREGSVIGVLCTNVPSGADTLLSLFRSARHAPGSPGVVGVRLLRLKESVISYRIGSEPSNDAACSQHTSLKKTYRRYTSNRIDAFAINGEHPFAYTNPEN
jgi:hypothetical protein